MSLKKVPLIILYTLAFWALKKPPNSLPPKEELVPSIKFENLYPIITPYVIYTFESISAFGEILTILAHANPQWKFSRLITSTLVKPGGDAGALGVTPLCLLGVILVVCGTIWRRWAYREMGRFFTYPLSIQKEHKLITTGPYAVVRHPGYLGMIVAYPGWFCWALSGGSWFWQSKLWNSPIGFFIFASYAAGIIAGSATFVCNRMGREDEVLRKEFGREWDQWAKKVPYAIIPGIY